MTHFGFKKVSLREKTQRVQDVFSRVASKYDRMNDAMSLGLHRLWKKELIKRVPRCPDSVILDLAAGTCDVSLLAYEHLRPLSSTVIAVDPNGDMLSAGRDKSINKGISSLLYCQAAGEALPLHDASVDCILLSFGLRNATDPMLMLAECMRVLKTGGVLLCLELSVPQGKMRHAYTLYTQAYIPLLGRALAKDSDAYRYLTESIEVFMSPQDVCLVMQECGYQNTSYTSLCNGVVTLYEAWNCK